MAEVPSKFMEEAAAVAQRAHGAARDDRDTRQDERSAQLLSMYERLLTNTTAERLAENTRFSGIASDVAGLKLEMAENTKITAQVRDVLASFKTIAAVSKWLTVIIALVASAIALLKGIINFK